MDLGIDDRISALTREIAPGLSFRGTDNLCVVTILLQIFITDCIRKLLLTR